MSTPQSIIKVCSGVRLDSSYTNSIFFLSPTHQATYFENKVVKRFTAYSYIRKSWDIKVNVTLEEADTWNYLFFMNSTDGKTYYYFINNVEYVSDNTVRLSLEMDFLQTYLFEFSDNGRLKTECFIERQHSVSDSIGVNTVPEDLDLGELVCNRTVYDIGTATDDSSNLKKMCVLVMSSVNPATGDRVAGGSIGGVYSGLGVYAVSSDRIEDLAIAIYNMDTETEAIVNMWVYPRHLVSLMNNETWEDEDVLFHPVGAVDNLDFTVVKNYGSEMIDGYTPVNNKLYTYPFNFLYCSNNQGGSAVYHYEKFDGSVCDFRAYGSISPDAGVLLAPRNYKGVASNYEEGIALSSYPTCAWNADMYKIWLATNQNQHKLAMTSSGLTIAAGAVSGIAGLATGNMIMATAGGGAVVSGASQIASLLAQKKDAEVQPPQARGNQSSSVNIANGKQTFSFYFKSVNRETAKIIDDYFTMYGYRQNRIGKPDLNARSAFTYVKTIGCNIFGEFGNEASVKIANIFDKGITWWTNGDNIGDYSIDNLEIA